MFYDRLSKLCLERKITPNKALVDCEISRTAVAKWRKGAVPNGANIQKLADYFGVTTDYLLGAETEKAPTQEGERQISDDDMMFALWGDTEEMDQADLDDVKRYADYVRERKRKK